MLTLAVLLGICVLLNLVPSAIATAAVVAVVALRDGVGDVEAVVVGAAGATIGRLLLAIAVRHGALRFVRGALAANVQFLTEYVGARSHATRFLALLSASPVNPALAIFVTAGALRLRLMPIACCYASGRLLVYGWAVGTAAFAASSIERVVRERATPLPLAIGLVIAIVPIVVIARLDWRHLLEARRPRVLRRERP